MPSSWNETVAEQKKWTQPNGQPDFDGFRRSTYKALADHTGRPLIVYATDFLNRDKLQACSGDVSVDLTDREGVREVTRNLKSKTVDFIISSPGGSPEAADTIVKALRRRFEHIRIFIPGVAKSAATMIALSAHQLVVEADAELGPIDPQMGVRRGDTTVRAPAQAIIDQFEKAQQLIGADTSRLPAWIPILQQYGPALYQECLNAISLSKRYVRDWLLTGMLAAVDARRRKRIADKVVNYLGSHNRFKTHGARVGFAELQSTGLPVELLNDNAVLCELVMSVHQAVQITFGGTGAFRIWENSQGDAYLRVVQQQQIVLPIMPGMPGMPTLPPGAQPAPPPHP